MKINPKLNFALNRSVLQVQKHSPIILTTAGIVGVVASGVLAARATLKLESTVNASAARLSAVKLAIENGEATPAATRVAVAHNVLDLVKLYGPSVTLGAVSLVCIVSAQGILHKRNAALVVLYKGLEQSYAKYRKSVVAELGEAADERFRLGITETTETDDKGKKTKVTTVDPTVAEEAPTIFSFGPENDNWEGRHDSNIFFLTTQQNLMNDILRFQGHLFLNEVLDKLAIPRTTMGSLIGWVYDDKVGDGYIDFGIKDLQKSNGYVNLDFNVDGIIYDKI